MKKKTEPYFAIIPAALCALFLLVLLMSFRTPKYSSPYDLNGFAQLPVLNGGRVKPIDSIARSSLLVLSGKQSVSFEGKRLSALEWLITVLYDSEKAHNMPVFQINDPDVLGMMNLEQGKTRFYSFHDLQKNLEEIDRQSTAAGQVKAEVRSRFQTAVFNLGNQVTLVQKLQNTLQLAGEDHQRDDLVQFETTLLPLLQKHILNPHSNSKSLKYLASQVEKYQFMAHAAEFYPIPTQDSSPNPDGWVSMGKGILDRPKAVGFNASVLAYAAMGDAFRGGDGPAFNHALHRHQEWLKGALPRETGMASYEVAFNRIQPFYQSLVMYAAVFLLAVLSWLIWPKTFARAAFWLLILSFTVHTVGLISRMLIQGRPPVTNLYSSAIFVGWVSVLLGILLERMFKRGIGSSVAAVIGFVTLIVAHHLASQGDTLEMMRAVLDSNMWLATHVVCITIGYSATFLAGALGILYLVRRRFDPEWTQEAGRTIEKMVYGVVCFATFFSFLGTILGGIWADQSWGRFWGWDPKENGALMIVMWNAFILHARWGKIGNQKTLMMMAVFGNIITALSWFGVNMLGIGLHSYGFMQKAFVWLVLFVASQLLIMALGLFAPQPAVKKTAE